MLYSSFSSYSSSSTLSASCVVTLRVLQPFPNLLRLHKMLFFFLLKSENSQTPAVDTWRGGQLEEAFVGLRSISCRRNLFIKRRSDAQHSTCACVPQHYSALMITASVAAWQESWSRSLNLFASRFLETRIKTIERKWSSRENAN